MPMSSKAIQRKYGRPAAALGIFLFVVMYLNDGLFGGPSSRRSYRIQHDFGKDAEVKALAQPSRQRAVRKEFIHAWTGYQDHGWVCAPI
jgi:hypothetical protein